MNPLRTFRSVARFGRIETNPIERRLARAASVADLRRIAKRRLLGGVFDYIDGGAETEHTLAANTRAFADTEFNPLVLRGLDQVDTSTSILGQPAPLPLALAPTGFTRIVDPAGELAVARAAQRAASRTRCPRWPPAQSKKSAMSATVDCGSRSTPGATADWSPT